ncbi:hypothetical protein [Desertibaculum subflavum]|uniref:hypothetical protein n=1 Tax=Desertibaculum subflavum TaxID=2268458 RepID=UPI000E66124F
MSDTASDHLITADALIRGAVIRAVLHCDRSTYANQPEVEVLELPVLLGQGDNVWAFSRSLHGPISPLGGRGIPCAYGYSTRYGLVANASHLDGLARVYDLAAYAAHRFLTVEAGDPIWQPGADEGPLKAAIEAGRRLRAVLETASGLTLGLSVHLAEYHGRRDVALFTEYEAVPAFVLAAPFLERISAEVAAKRGAATGPIMTGLLDPQRTAFESLYFRLSTDGRLMRWDPAAHSFATAEVWKRLTILAR